MSRKEKFLYLFYVVTHPFDGFYEIRHRNRGSIPLALLLIFLFGLSFSMNRRYASFVVNTVNPRYVDSRQEIIGIFVAVLLFSAANWSITCLLEGEGRFKDVLTVMGYSLLPMVLTFLPATLLSQFIASDEEGIYFLIIGISVVYSVLLMLVGIMVIHNFGFGKTLVTLALTFIALVIIIFLIMLLSSLVQQVYFFLDSVYTEIVLRA
jgi:hypothetical protein